PEMSLDASVIIGDGGSDDYYFVTPRMLNHPVIMPRLRKVTIAVVYNWPGGVVSLWPVPLAGETRIACWKSARAAYELSKTQWVQLSGTTTDAITTSSLLKASTPNRTGHSIYRSATYCGSASLTRSSTLRSIPMSCGSAGLSSSFDRFR